MLEQSALPARAPTSATSAEVAEIDCFHWLETAPGADYPWWPPLDDEPTEPEEPSP